MKLYKAICIVCAMQMFVHTYSQPDDGWRLVFEDNFDGTELDMSKWNYNYTWGHTHNHQAYMDESQVAVEDGKLKITAIPWIADENRGSTDKWSNQFGTIYYNCTSGAVNTNGKFNFTYGYMEGSFKMSDEGTWPAFWTLNANGAWPPEIDILEVPKARDVHHYYYHYSKDGGEASFGGTSTNMDKRNGFHTYGCEWGPNYMHFYFDGKQISTNWHDMCSEGVDMYLIINLAVGGWAGKIEEAKLANYLPSTYECDWVKVWQRDRNFTENMDFEAGELARWGKWNDVSVTANCNHSGDYGIQLVGSPASSERVIDVEPNSTYVFGGWAKVPGETSTMIGVKGYGGEEKQSSFSSSNWEKKEIRFTTGSSNKTARIYFYQSSGSGVSCGDDFYVRKSEVDCNGDLDGGAYYDNCGECVGGSTGKEQCASVAIEAENLCEFDGSVETNHANYSGEGFVNVPNGVGASITISVNAQSEGEYVLIATFGNGSNTNRDCEVVVNGNQQHGSINFPALEGKWETWQIAKIPVQLQAGENTIEILANQSSGGPNFDKFTVTGNGISYHLCGGTANQDVNLKKGWNLISFTTMPNSGRLLELLLGKNVSYIKNFDSFYNVDIPVALNTISALQYWEGYLVYCESDKSFSIEGNEAIDNSIKNLTLGWNIYAPKENITVDKFIETNPDVLVVKDFDSFYTVGENANSLTALEVGKAYFVKLK